MDSMIFDNSLDYMEFWEQEIESLEDDEEENTFEPSIICAGNSGLRQLSPNVFADHTSDEEDVTSNAYLDSKKATILNQVNQMILLEQDGVKVFLMNSIRTNFTTSSSSTTRELFYKCPLNVTMDAFYKKLHQLFTSLNVLPSDLKIFTSPKGLIAGDLKIILDNEVIIQCHVSVATTIPCQIENLKIETKAETIVLVEKDTVFEKLIEQKIFKKLENVILLTGKGYPDINTRLFLKKVLELKKFQVYCLVDGDPYGIHIMTIYRYGSKALNQASEQLSCPEIKWIGITPSEMRKFNLPKSPLTLVDQTKLNKMLEREYLNLNIKKELEIMKKIDAKTEIEYLSLPPFNYNLTDYIAQKIKDNLCI
ncbi:SPO11 family protein [Megaselia abdita]